MMHCVDWLPTLMDAANLEWKNKLNLDGFSHWNNFININTNNTINQPRDFIYYGNDNPGTGDDRDGYCGNNTAYRDHHYKIYNTTGGDPDKIFNYYDDTINSINETRKTYNYNYSMYSLYNINEDPSEYNNIAANNTDLVQSLAQQLYNIDSTRVPALPDNASCPKGGDNHPINPIVGPYWWPWCN